MKQVEVAVIGTGWCGGIRAETLSRSALVDKLHVCEIRPERLAEIKALTKPATATTDYQDIIRNDASRSSISTPRRSNALSDHARLPKAGKHVLLEKPVALELWEADELITLAKRGGLKFTIGYSQRFNPKIAFAKKKITDGTLGNVVSRPGQPACHAAISARRSPAAPSSRRWRWNRPMTSISCSGCSSRRSPCRSIRRALMAHAPLNGSFDCMWSTVTMDNGVLVVIGGGWNLPPGWPNFCSTWMEITGTEGALMLDDTHRDNWLNTVKDGSQFPMSSMPGEHVDHVFAGQMGPETIHFLEACILDRPVMVKPEHARMVMETYIAADLSAERGEPVALPLSNQALSAVAEMSARLRA